MCRACVAHVSPLASRTQLISTSLPLPCTTTTTHHNRPLSKHKNFVVFEIVKPEKVYDAEKSKILADEFEQQARARTRQHGLDMGFAANVISPTAKPGPATWDP